MQVLLATADFVTAHALRRALGRAGFQVMHVSEGREALALLTGPAAPRVAVLDRDLPQIDGVEICRRMRAREDYVFCALLCPPEGAEASVRRPLYDEADAVFLRPVDPADLLVRLQAARRLLAPHDPLDREQTAPGLPIDARSGVWTRSGVDEFLRMTLEGAERRGAGVGVIHIRLRLPERADRELLLRASAARVRETVRANEGLGRVGTDELRVVVCTTEGAVVERVAERIRARLGEPITTPAGPVVLCPEVGAAYRASARGTDADGLVAEATAA